MKLPQSKVGLTLVGVFVMYGLFMIFTGGLFAGFGIVVLGMPWTMMLAYVGFFELLSSLDLFISEIILFPLAIIIFLVPIGVNIFVLYWLGAYIEKLFFKIFKKRHEDD